MSHGIEPDGVDLETESQPRLRDPPTRFDLSRERLKFGNEFGIHIGDEARDHPSEKDPTESRTRFARECALTECDSTGRRVRPGAEEFEFGEHDHAARVSPRLSTDPVGRGGSSNVSIHD